MPIDQIYKQYNLTDDLSPNLEFEYIELHDFFDRDNDNPYKDHTHSFYQIIWFQHGNGVHYVDFKEYPIIDNTLFFISPGQIHSFDRNTNFDGIILHFNESFLSDEQSSENIFLKYNVFNAFDAVPYYTIEDNSIERLHYIVNEIKIELNQENSFAHHDYLQYLIKMFLIYTQRNAHRGSGISLCINNAANRTFVQFRQLLEHYYKRKHTVKEFAHHRHLSTKALSKSVKESSRQTPSKIINESSTPVAKRLLLYCSLKIKEVGYELGYADPYYFVKFFKRQTGFLPAQFRRLKIK